jgi:chromosome segregation ATPase
MLALSPTALAVVSDTDERRRRASSARTADDAASTSALERALADARTRARESSVKVCELEESCAALAIAAGRAETRAKALGERLADAERGASSTLERDALETRVKALETANERLRVGLREKSERVDALEAEVREGRHAEDSAGDAATTTETETETAARREREIVRLRGELSRQAQVIADAYRDEVQRLQRELAMSQGRCERAEKENAQLKKKLATRVGERRTYESPYAYAKYEGKIDTIRHASSPSRSPLARRCENVFERLATPKRISERSSPAISPKSFR